MKLNHKIMNKCKNPLWYWHKIVMQINGKEYKYHIHLCICSQLVFTGKLKSILGERTIFLINGAGKIRSMCAEYERGSLSYTLHKNQL